MRPERPLWVALPGPLLLLVASAAATAALDQQQQKLQEEKQWQGHPTAIRKMPPDEDEKFFPHYVAFPPSGPASGLQLPVIGAAPNGDDDDAAGPSFRPAFMAHRRDTTLSASEEERWAAEALARRDVLGRLERRQWGCPTGTNSCAGIGYPNSCCRIGETCYEIPDTGLGPVGCCATGNTCSGSIACAPGDVACPSELGGGCCMPGFVCAGIGCVRITTTSRDPGGGGGGTSQITTLTSTSTSTTVAQPGPSTTIVVTITITTTPSNGGPPATLTTTSTATSGGGGTDQQPTQTQTPTPTTTSPTESNGNGPVKPTLTETNGLPTNYCPTGYYACLAHAGYGCCQTNRDCATTNCPAPPPSTTIVSDGVTVVVPVPVPTGAGSSPPTCAGGWFLCPASAGPVPGCCPTGYACGTASCTLSAATATITVQKELPRNGGARLRGTGPAMFSALMAAVCVAALGTPWLGLL